MFLLNLWYFKKEIAEDKLGGQDNQERWQNY